VGVGSEATRRVVVAVRGFAQIPICPFAAFPTSSPARRSRGSGGGWFRAVGGAFLGHRRPHWNRIQGLTGRPAWPARTRHSRDRMHARHASGNAQTRSAPACSSASRHFDADLWLAVDEHDRQVEAQIEWREDLANELEGADPGSGSTEPMRRAHRAHELIAPPFVEAKAAGLLQRDRAPGSQVCLQPVGG
jgi:hypothetical protein